MNFRDAARQAGFFASTAGINEYRIAVNSVTHLNKLKDFTRGQNATLERITATGFPALIKVTVDERRRELNEENRNFYRQPIKQEDKQ